MQDLVLYRPFSFHYFNRKTYLSTTIMSTGDYKGMSCNAMTQTQTQTQTQMKPFALVTNNGWLDLFLWWWSSWAGP